MKIPPSARKAFSGVVFDVYQWDQELYDGSHAVFEMAKRAPSVVVLAVSVDGEIFYTAEEQPGREPFLSLVAGGVEAGESPLEAAKRELLEEAGIVAGGFREIEIWNHYGKIEWSVHFYVADDCVKVAEPTPDAGEKIEVRRADFDTFVKIARDDPSFRIHEISHKLLRLSFDGGLDEFKNLVLLSVQK